MPHFTPLVIPNEREESHEAGLAQRCCAAPAPWWLKTRRSRTKVPLSCRVERGILQGGPGAAMLRCSFAVAQDVAQYDKEGAMLSIQSTNKG